MPDLAGLLESFEIGAPIVALSIRQPWAWLIVNGFKDVENRTWRTHRLGPILIHASKGMQEFEYEDARNFALDRGVSIPNFELLERGGIVGLASIRACLGMEEVPPPELAGLQDSKWFTGPIGFFLERARPCVFHACPGALSFFTPEIVKTIRKR